MGSIYGNPSGRKCNVFHACSVVKGTDWGPQKGNPKNLVGTYLPGLHIPIITLVFPVWGPHKSGLVAFSQRVQYYTQPYIPQSKMRPKQAPDSTKTYLVVILGCGGVEVGGSTGLDDSGGSLLDPPHPWNDAPGFHRALRLRRRDRTRDLLKGSQGFGTGSSAGRGGHLVAMEWGIVATDTYWGA